MGRFWVFVMLLAFKYGDPGIRAAGYREAARVRAPTLAWVKLRDLDDWARRPDTRFSDLVRMTLTINLT